MLIPSEFDCKCRSSSRLSCDCCSFSRNSRSVCSISFVSRSVCSISFISRSACLIISVSELNSKIKEAIICRNLRPQMPSNCQAFYSSLIQRSWKHDPQKRIRLSVVIDTLVKELGKLGIACTLPMVKIT